MTDGDALLAQRRETLRALLDRTRAAGRADWWVDTGPGWWPLIVQLDADIAKLYPDYQILQVKEKFGGLRYYIGGVPADVYGAVHELIDRAEAKSFTICERCGAPGKVRSGGWILTLCNECEEKRRQQLEARR
jgi:hypothetical protein